MTDYETRACFEEDKPAPPKPLMELPEKSGHPSTAHLLLIFAVAIFFSLLLAFGCTSPKNMMARRDCDEKVRLIVEAMRARTDTTVKYRTDTLVLREFRSDTILKIDTLIHTIEKERLRVQWQVIRDTMRITAQCRTDTIYRTVAETTIKQGSLTTLVPDEKESEGMPGWLWGVGILGILAGGFLVYRKFFT